MRKSSKSGLRRSKRRSGRIARGLAAFLAAMWFCAAFPVAVAQAEQARPPLKAGTFLVAGPRLTDPNFVETVILLISHGEDGAIGLIVNRPTNIPSEEALPEVEELKGLNIRLHFGGPVHPQRLFALVETDRTLEGAQRVLKGVTFTGNRDALLTILKDAHLKRSARLYAGYAGWAPGQLEQEMRRGAWVIKDADVKSVFSPHPLELWNKLMGRGIGIQVYLPRADGWRGSADHLDQPIMRQARGSLGPLRRIPDGDQGYGHQMLRDG